MSSMPTLLVENNKPVQRYISANIDNGQLSHLSTDCPHLWSFMDMLGFVDGKTSQEASPTVVCDLSELDKLRVGFRLESALHVYEVNSFILVYNVSLSVPNSIKLYMEFISKAGPNPYILSRKDKQPHE